MSEVPEIFEIYTRSEIEKAFRVFIQNGLEALKYAPPQDIAEQVQESVSAPRKEIIDILIDQFFTILNEICA